MERLVINGRDAGEITSRRYNRVSEIDGCYNGWHFLIQSGYEIVIRGRNIKRMAPYTDKTGNYLKIDTFC